MAQVINTNIPSLNAQRNLTHSQSALATSLQRLSSGMRINSAKDDAAGLAISERFTTQVRGLNQAIRNANDGVSLAQTGEGALAEVTSNLQRIRELAVQSVNSSNSSSDRAALQLEVQQRLDEIDRTAAQTSFNGQKILDGTFGSAAFQVGANVGETISVGLSTSMRSTAIGKTADYVGTVTGANTVFSSATAAGTQGAGVNQTNALNNNVTIAIGSNQAVSIGVSSSGSALGQSAGSAFAKVAAINAAGVSGLTATADTTININFATAATAGYALSINTIQVQSAAAAGLTGSALASNINANSSATGVTAAFNAGVMTLTAIDGRDITIDQTATATQGFTTTPAGQGTNNTVNDALTWNAGNVSAIAVGSIHLISTNTINVQGAGVADLGYTAASMALGNSALNSASVTTVANANTAISRIDSALDAVSTLRSTFGAIQNRFESVSSSLAATSENLTAARGRILDADYAQETASLTRNQILQQAGIAMLSQANQLPNTVLSLLK